MQRLIKSNAMQSNKTNSTLENAIPVSDEYLGQLEADGVEYRTVKQNEGMSGYTWIEIIPTAKSFLGLFHAGIHVGINFQRRRAA